MSLLKSYQALSRRQRIAVGVFGIVSSLVCMWFTENKLSAGDREQRPLGLVARPLDASEKRQIIRLAPKRTDHTESQPPVK
jgi:hypothetical protein